MRKFLLYLFLGLFGLVFLLFLLANRETVFISLDPINPADPAIALGPMPLWGALMAMLFLGYALGGFAMWMSGRGLRKRAAERKRRIRELEREVALTGDAPPPAPRESLPAIRHPADKPARGAIPAQTR